MRNVLIATTILIVTFSCTKEPILDIREGMTFNPDSLSLEANSAGWELYSWKSGDIWRYSMMAGVDRIRTTEEIWANPFSVKGKEQLKLLIRQLPSGEEITWRGNEWTTDNMDDLINKFDLPPLLTQYDLHSFSVRNAITLEITP